jgi:hypothetical protein
VTSRHGVNPRIDEVLSALWKSILVVEERDKGRKARGYAVEDRRKTKYYAHAAGAADGARVVGGVSPTMTLWNKLLTGAAAARLKRLETSARQAASEIQRVRMLHSMKTGPGATIKGE